jgi:hypothetical protein
LIFLFFFFVQDLAFYEDVNVSSYVASVLERVADKNGAMRVAIGRMIKYNIPRFLRLTDVTDDNYCNIIILALLFALI